MVAYAGVIVTLSSPPEGVDEALSLAETAMLSLWAKTADEPNSAQSLTATVLHLQDSVK
jgi:hypothetical protein